MADDLVELEIAAFMGPHIKRARIMLFAVGAIDVVLGALAYPDIAQARDMMQQLHADPMYAHVSFAAADHAVTLASVLVIGAIVAGAANIVLAAIGGKQTTRAMYAAMAIFIAFSAIQLDADGVMLFSSLLWWFTAIILGLAFTAARKADKLRATARS
ncbi:MAG TPA: hypothetical protein VGG74_02105 [Kofleriaceae bacterium]|jgi:hypothetical protein